MKKLLMVVLMCTACFVLNAYNSPVCQDCKGKGKVAGKIGRCERCKGTGKTEYVKGKCSCCNGSGKIAQAKGKIGKVSCLVCKGTGNIPEDACLRCNGTGNNPESDPHAPPYLRICHHCNGKGKEIVKKEPVAKNDKRAAVAGAADGLK